MTRVERSVALVGPRGAGKTTVGRLLAARLGLAFLDLDEVLAERGGAAGAGTLLARLGEPAFREREARLLEELLPAPAEGEPLVLATGGGAVLPARSRALLRERARVVWLRVERARRAERLASDPTLRPPLTTGGAAHELAALEREREPLYREVAHAAFDCEALDPDAIADALADGLRPAER